MALAIGLQACGDAQKTEGKGTEAAISGTITLDPSAQPLAPKEPLLIITASKSSDPKKPPIIIKRVPNATFPLEYKLTPEDITLVGSTFEGRLYITARIDTGHPGEVAGAGNLEGTYAGNPVPVGSTRVDVAITAPSRAAAKRESVAPSPASPGAKLLRVGLLWSGSTPFGGSSVPEELREAFRELGYVEGQNVAFEPRYAEGSYDRLPNLAAGLVGLKVDIILAAGDSAALRAAKDATGSIPIVMMALADTVRLGLVHSLARPGENITGLSFPMTAIAAKQLDLLKNAVPRVSRVAILWNPANPGHAPVVEEINPAAQTLKIQLQFVKVRGPEDFEGAFEAMKAGHVEAVLVLWDPMFYAHGGRLTLLALRHKLPTISTYREFAEAAGLMSYGPRLTDIFRGAASYADKIVAGAKPADLPVEKPTRFELVINLASAKALGLTISQSLLLRADEVIR
jgi:putative ABC transport system substrate-binding protein